MCCYVELALLRVAFFASGVLYKADRFSYNPFVSVTELAPLYSYYERSTVPDLSMMLLPHAQAEQNVPRVQHNS